MTDTTTPKTRNREIRIKTGGEEDEMVKQKIEKEEKRERKEAWEKNGPKVEPPTAY